MAKHILLKTERFSVFLILLLVTLLSLTSCQLLKQTTDTTSEHEPFADVHLHYNFRHEEVISPQKVVAILKQHNIRVATVSSEPTDYALKLADQGKGWILPFASPYYQAGNRHRWHRDRKLVPYIRKQLQTGRYHGIGEVHLTAGLRPRRDNPVFVGLLKLAIEFKLPVLIHTDSSDPRYFREICQRFPQIRCVWAHAGGVLGPRRLTTVMQACPKVWLDLAARDPWHYGLLAHGNGQLLPGWKQFLIRYQDRVMTGTDPVWNAHQTYRWYEADEGWKHYRKMIRFQRLWLKQLPPEAEKKIRLTNALKFYKTPGR